MSRSSWTLVLLVCAAVVLRIVLALRPGIWGDEIFSLAMATGHSLEHPAAEARSALGDFVEPKTAVPSGTFRRYVEHENQPASPARVIRAVALVRHQSSVVLPAAACLDPAVRHQRRGAPPVFRGVRARGDVDHLAAGRDLGGAPVGRTAVLLFALSPVSLFYSVEGRMYSLLWVLAAAFASTTLALSRRGFSPMLVLAWVGLGVGGLLTHYFFLFTWCGTACLARLGRRAAAPLDGGRAGSPHGARRRSWYSQVPASLGRWRVTGLAAQPLAWPGALSVPISLGWRLLAGGGVWGGSEWVDGLLALTFVVMAVYLARRGGVRPLFEQDRLLLWAWVLAAVLGVFVFDILRGTSASYLTRYALAGFPAAMLLVALAVEQLPARARSGFLVLMVLAWSRRRVAPAHPSPPALARRTAP